VLPAVGDAEVVAARIHNPKVGLAPGSFGYVFSQWPAGVQDSHAFLVDVIDLEHELDPNWRLARTGVALGWALGRADSSLTALQTQIWRVCVSLVLHDLESENSDVEVGRGPEVVGEDLPARCHRHPFTVTYRAWTLPFRWVIGLRRRVQVRGRWRERHPRGPSHYQPAPVRLRIAS